MDGRVGRSRTDGLICFSLRKKGFEPPDSSTWLNPTFLVPAHNLLVALITQRSQHFPLATNTMGSARGGRRQAGRSNRSGNDNAQAVDSSDPPQPPDLRTVLELVSQNPVLQQAHVINGALVVQGLNAVESPVVCQSAKETLVEMIQGNGPSFAVLKGACLTLSQPQCRASISRRLHFLFYFIR